MKWRACQGRCLAPAGCRLACALSFSSQRDRSNARIHLQTLKSSRQTLAASHTRNNILTSSCPCVHCRPLIPSTEPSFVSLACDSEVVAWALPGNEQVRSSVVKNKIFIKCK